MTSINEEQYGSIPLSAVQRIVSHIYKCDSYLDTQTNVIMINRPRKGLTAFKPLTNPRHIVEVLARTLELESVDGLRRNFLGDYIIMIFDQSCEFKGKTIWTAVALCILHLMSYEEELR